MKIVKLKSALKFWQEIIYFIAIGIWVIVMTKNIFQGIIFIIPYCVFISLFIFLFVQFFWESKILGKTLAIVMGLGSTYMFFGWLIESAYKIEGYGFDMLAIFSLFLFGGLSVTAISMFVKYGINK